MDVWGFLYPLSMRLSRYFYLSFSSCFYCFYLAHDPTSFSTRPFSQFDICFCIRLQYSLSITALVLYVFIPLWVTILMNWDGSMSTGYIVQYVNWILSFPHFHNICILSSFFLMTFLIMKLFSSFIISFILICSPVSTIKFTLPIVYLDSHIRVICDWTQSRIW